MKVRFFSVLAVLIIVIAGFTLYLTLHKASTSPQKVAPTLSITSTPTDTPPPTLTPVPSDYENDSGLYPAYQINGGIKTYGYISSDGEFKIAPSFENAGDFHDGVAIVQFDYHYYLINTTGSILYSSNDALTDYKNEAAAIIKDSPDYAVLYGYLDNKGNQIIKPSYRVAGNFASNGTAYAQLSNNQIVMIDKSGTTLNTYHLDNKYHVTSIADNYLIYSNSSNNLYGVVSPEGKDIIPPNYCEITYLGDNLFALKKPDDSFFGVYSEMPAAIFNSSYQQITDFTLYDITPFHNGFASATDDKYTFFIGKDGKEVTSLPKFEGRGKVTLYGDIVKAEIDHDLTYCKKDGSVIWHSPTSQMLSNGIKVNSVKLRTNKFALIYYPQLEGLSDTSVQNTINTKLESIFTDSRTSLKEADKYSVDDNFKASMIRKLLIIERDGYDYPFGAAHGSPIMDYLYIDTTTGAFYQLNDLFIQDSDYVSAINEIIKADIAASDNANSMYFENGFQTIADNQDFILAPDSLTIYFYPNDIAAYAVGFPQFKIPIEKLYEYIDFKGAFWSAFH